jgi:hypothetical protein
MHVTSHNDRRNKQKDFVIPAVRFACSGEQTNTNVDAQTAALLLKERKPFEMGSSTFSNSNSNDDKKMETETYIGN